ncbi:GNAT family N-acetyltransferase [Mucilaginibacter rubeus]|uniref:GNAT family N-acetyltransferase n=1 Tax=Mucilaginibacter rubeus TaxID=2027860 RepID=UPI001663B286|nr:GNAT family N-acetyltransferase [Mucilaginibacter rubeus]GGB24338.1 N-acetyltransferase [Mucilaginibacter rubeus]
MNIITQTPRLLIREFTAGDEELVTAIDADDRLTQYVKKRTPQESKQVFKDTLKEYQNGSGLGRWGIFNIADNDFIGVCALKPSDYDKSRIELGYRLHLKYWGQGIATELAEALISYGFNDIGLKEICAVTHPQNAASQRVLIKAGFVREGIVFWYGEDVPFFRVKNPTQPSPEGRA